jgi:hypothetical protein
MYEELTQEQYSKLSLQQRVDELKKWIENELENFQNYIRNFSSSGMENEDIEDIIATPLDELPPLINTYPEDSAQHFLVKYRLAHNIEDCEESILDATEYGKLCCKLAHEAAEDESKARYLNYLDEGIHDSIVICNMFGFEDLRKNLKAWAPSTYPTK